MPDHGRIYGRQAAFKASKGKNFQMLMGSTQPSGQGADITDLEADIEIHDSVCPDGESGYTTYEYRTVDGVDQMKCTGEGCGGRTTEWEVIGDL